MAVALGIACALLGIGLSLPATGQPAPPGPRLTGFWPAWLERIGPLLTSEERLYFEILETDSARESFVEGFWRSRGTPALERWTRNRADARRFRSRSPGRSRVVLLAGKPGSIETFQRCGPMRRLEVWEWEPWHLGMQGAEASETQYLILVEATTLSMSSFEPWTPGDVEGLTRGLGAPKTVEAMIEALRAETCIGGGALARLGEALERALSFDQLRSLTAWPEAGSDWLEELARSPAPAAATLRLSYPGSFTRFTILRGEIEVPTERLLQLGPGQLFDRVTVTGDVFRNNRLADSFQIVHHVAGAAPGDSVRLDIYRRLEPGANLLRLRVADRHGLALLREELDLEVPEAAEPAPEPAGHAEGLSRLTRSDLVQLNTFPSVELLPAVLGPHALMSLRAITTGGPIGSVEFVLAGEVIARDDQPPYSVELEPVSETTPLEARALDPLGRALAVDSRMLEPASRPFAVHFGPVSAGRARVPVDLSVPAGEEVESFECRHARRVIHRSVGPPYDCPLPEAPVVGADYLTATVTLVGGEVQDDVLFIGPRKPEEIDVQLAELYLSILDPAGRPASGLQLDDVRVWEDGELRQVVRVQPVANLPLNVGLLMDISSSMGHSLRVAADSAQDFFESVLRGEDLASLLAFNHDLHPLVSFTADTESLRYGATGLSAWGATRLYDAMVHALFQFTGRTSRRALIVLSDGSDVGSDFQPEQVLDFAIQAGVAVYPISLGRVDEASKAALERLAGGSGGRAFRVASAARLPDVYRQIEDELRAQYLLVYEPSRPGLPEPARVEVEVMREGYSAREVRRYYR